MMLSKHEKPGTSTDIAAPETEDTAPATREALTELHAMLIRHCRTYMAATPPEKRTASMLEVIRAVLKDNGVHCDPRDPTATVSEALAELSDLKLPFND